MKVLTSAAEWRATYEIVYFMLMKAVGPVCQRNLSIGLWNRSLKDINVNNLRIHSQELLSAQRGFNCPLIGRTARLKSLLN